MCTCFSFVSSIPAERRRPSGLLSFFPPSRSSVLQTVVLEIQPQSQAQRITSRGSILPFLLQISIQMWSTCVVPLYALHLVGYLDLQFRKSIKKWWMMARPTLVEGGLCAKPNGLRILFARMLLEHFHSSLRSLERPSF